MNLFLLLPIFACITCSVLSISILGRGARGGEGRQAALVAAAAAFWALCDLLWNTAHEPEAALAFVRLASIGSISIGPLTLHLFWTLIDHPLRRRRSVVTALYATTAMVILTCIFTPWVSSGVVKTAWGWGYRVGGLFPIAYAFTGLTFFAGLMLGIRAFRSSVDKSERRQAAVVLGSMTASLLVASLTDGLLPTLDIQVPRLGVVSLTLFALTVAWGFKRYGYSVLAPGVFASEILATLPDGVALLRLDGIVRFANSGMEKLAGAEAGGLESRPIEHLISEVRGRTSQELSARECSLRAASGEVIPISLSTSLLRDKLANPIGLVLVVRDLREVANLRRSLIASDRLAAVGQLAAGIAHEINNPVAFVRANLGTLGDLLESVASKLSAELAAELAEAIADGRDLIAESLDGVDRVASIVRDVKGFSHAGDVMPQRVDLVPLLESVLRVSAPQLPAGCRVETTFGEVPAVEGAPQELKQVFLNLVINAAQAIREGDAIRVRAFGEGRLAVVIIEDEGHGIAPELLDRIFDPFFTTKAVGEGTGLGLSISYQIVTAHGGRISVESLLGRGTRFRVELPGVGERGRV